MRKTGKRNKCYVHISESMLIFDLQLDLPSAYTTLPFGLDMNLGDELILFLCKALLIKQCCKCD